MTGASKIDEKTPHSANRILKFPSNVPSFCSERPQGASRNILCRLETGARVGGRGERPLVAALKS